MNRPAVVAIAAAASLALTIAPSLAQTKVRAGTLTCTGGEGVGLILGSKKTYRCRYKPAGSGQPQSYDATVTKLGLDIGVTGKTTMVWTVLATTTNVNRGMLAGNYAGAAADAALGIGGGAKVLVGGSNDSVVLQPVSVQGQTGINLAVGIAGMTLR
ncbi:MAG: hypothetical protein RLZ98_2195 [Pseudomonadota bacterium]